MQDASPPGQDFLPGTVRGRGGEPAIGKQIILKIISVGCFAVWICQKLASEMRMDYNLHALLKTLLPDRQREGRARGALSNRQTDTEDGGKEGKHDESNIF